MAKQETIQIFEHGKLVLGKPAAFQKAHFNQLVAYNESKGRQFFDVGKNTIYFRQYVGVIQVGKLTIEILPKADRTGGDKELWQNALLTMLHDCRYLRLKSLTEAKLALRKASLAELYFRAFLEEVTDLIHKGLRKRYRQQAGNLGVLKGRMHFPGHLNNNICNKARFYTIHEIYDRNHLRNRILKQALLILARIVKNNSLCTDANRLLVHFEEIADIQAKEYDFERIDENRHNEHYRYALQLARLIITHYSPDIKSGRLNTLAILFDMNRLFEQFVLVQFRKAARKIETPIVEVKGQSRKDFWRTNTLKPDIELSWIEEGRTNRVIIDTKWKVLSSAKPNASDLRQMYAYNLHFGARRSILIYPEADKNLKSTPMQAFYPSILNSETHACQVAFIQLFDLQGNKKPMAAEDFLRSIVHPQTDHPELQ